ncbi:MAG: hypothetical protein ACJ8R9_26420 [Steroidobacteraceae bacterium]
MNAKVLSSLATALVVTSFVPPAIAERLGEHPAVVVARTWNNRGIDPNTFIVAHPASTRWVSEAPKTADKLAHASEPRKVHWSTAIGTGYAARSTATNPKVTSSDEPKPTGRTLPTAYPHRLIGPQPLPREQRQPRPQPLLAPKNPCPQACSR